MKPIDSNDGGVITRGWGGGWAGRLWLLAAFLALMPVARSQILQQPVDQFIGTGQTATFTAQAEASPPVFYQWKRNGVFIAGTQQQSGSGLTDAILSIPGVVATNSGTYSVVFWTLDSQGLPAATYESVTAELVVTNLGILPATDQFPGNDLGPNLQGSLRGSNFVAAVGNEPGEPQHGGVPGGSSVWVRWKPLVNGIATFDTMGSGFDTTIGVYTGNVVSNLTLVARDEDRGGYLNSTASFNAVADVEYLIAIDGFYGAQGRIVLNWSMEVTSDKLPEITVQPQDKTVLPGAAAALAVSVSAATAASNPTFQWFLNGQPIPLQKGLTISIPNVTPATLGDYSLQVLLDQGKPRIAFSEVAHVQANIHDGNASDPGVEAKAKFRSEADLSGGPAPSGFHLNSVAPAGGYSGTQMFSTVGAVKEPGEPNHCGEPGGASYWFTYQPPADGTLQVDSIGSSFNDVLAIYTGPGDSFATLVPVDCSATNSGAGNEVNVFSCQGGTNYFIVSDGVGGATGTLKLHYSLLTPPAILIPPSPKTANVSSNATFAVSAGGTPMLGYQWRFNDINITGATGAVYTVTNCQTTNAGLYRVVVTNSVGAVTSIVASLTINVKPTITNQPVGVTNVVGSNPSFSVVAGGSPLNYRWLYNTNQTIAGATNSVYVVANAQLTNAGTYHVIITNAAGAVTSAIATLTVLGPPVITNGPVSQTVLQGNNVTLLVGVTGTLPLAYQWRTNGFVYAGRTATSLAVTNFQYVNEGGYDVVITNSVGAVTSASVNLFLIASNNVLRFTNSAYAGGGVFSSVVLGPTNTNYVVLVSTNLTNWSVVGTSAAPWGVVNFAATNLADTNRFFRARLP